MHAVPSRRTALLALVALLVCSRLPLAKDDAPKGGAKGQLAEVDARVGRELADLEAFYKHLHANPELSLMEFRTSARLAEELKKLHEAGVYPETLRV